MSNRERAENPTAEEQQKKAEREQPKAQTTVVKTVENLTLGTGDSYLLHPGATEETERAKREYQAEKDAELDRARALDRKPSNNDQFRKSTSEVEVRALDLDAENKSKKSK